jgi:hypothetical protein
VVEVKVTEQDLQLMYDAIKSGSTMVYGDC